MPERYQGFLIEGAQGSFGPRDRFRGVCSSSACPATHRGIRGFRDVTCVGSVAEGIDRQHFEQLGECCLQAFLVTTNCTSTVQPASRREQDGTKAVRRSHQDLRQE